MNQYDFIYWLGGKKTILQQNVCCGVQFKVLALL
jgi:hypothetical protein